MSVVPGGHLPPAAPPVKWSTRSRVGGTRAVLGYHFFPWSWRASYQSNLNPCCDMQALIA